MQYPVTGCGLGLRRDLLDDIEKRPAEVSFLELAPENWIGARNPLHERFLGLAADYPLICHGLSLSLGGPSPLDMRLLTDIKDFLSTYQIKCYSEHLSYCSDDGHLYDLMPIPFTEKAANYVADRIQRVQDFLGCKIAIENTSAYLAPASEMNEIEFIKLVLEKADCNLLLDVNNVYVNSVNFEFDPETYLRELPNERIAYCHIAGHSRENESLIVDTHGAEIVPPVWQLLNKSYELFGAIPTLLERDFNFPPFHELLEELRTIASCQQRYSTNNLSTTVS